MRSLLFAMALFGLAQAAPVEKLPVAMGSWKGPSAGSFKSALRGGLAKDCRFVPAKKARVIIDGEVTQEGKTFSVTVIVKSTKSGEVVEQRNFKFGKSASSAGKRMARDVVEIVRRSPANEP